MFVRMDVERDRWQQILRAPGRPRILGNDGVPSAIPDEVMTDVISRCPSAITNDELTVIPAGWQVRVIEGAMKGQEAVVTASAGKHVSVALVAFNHPVLARLTTKAVLILAA